MYHLLTCSIYIKNLYRMFFCIMALHNYLAKHMKKCTIYHIITRYVNDIHIKYNYIFYAGISRWRREWQYSRYSAVQTGSSQHRTIRILRSFLLLFLPVSLCLCDRVEIQKSISTTATETAGTIIYLVSH